MRSFYLNRFAVAFPTSVHFMCAMCAKDVRVRFDIILQKNKYVNTQTDMANQVRTSFTRGFCVCIHMRVSHRVQGHA